MNDSRRGIDGLAGGSMLLLCVIWGLQQVAVKVAAPDISPIMMLALRSLISAALVALFMIWRGTRIFVADGTLRPGAVAGVLFALEFIFVAEGLRLTTASHMAVFLYTAPVFSALGLQVLIPAERLRPLQWLGIGVAFGGIAVAFLGGAMGAEFSASMLLGDALGILAGAAWGWTTVVVRTTALSNAAPARTLLYQLIAGFVLMLVYALASGQAAQVSFTPLATSILVFNGVIVSFASYLIWFWLLRVYLASRLVVFSFMTPLFGVSFGVLLLGDPMSIHFIVGALLVLLGIFLVSGTSLLRRRL